MSILEQLKNINLELLMAQSAWIMAMGIAFSWLLQKDDKKTLRIIMFSYIFWIIHFLLMWVYSAAAASSVWVFRVFLSLKYKRNKRIFGWVIGATVVLWLITYNDHLSLLPIIGSCISAYWYFFFERIRLRVFMFVTSLFWFTFNVNIGSFWWIINEIIVQTILIIAMYKMLHEEWKRVYFVDRVMWIITRKEKFPDVGRFINIYDYIRIFKMWFKNKIKYFKEKIKSIAIPKISLKEKNKKSS